MHGALLHFKIKTNEGIEFVLDADQIQRICWNRVHITKITKNELTDGTVLIRSLKICD
jgi:hypothetical protein